jgi:dTDP-4-amino-4,6-dideoxygalactose transaminase
MKTIDLFRPFLASGDVHGRLSEVLTPDAETGRLYIGQGEQVEAFERALKTILCAQQDVLTLNSCTSALDLALHLCGLGTWTVADVGDTRDDVVISTPMTCSATNSPVVTKGGRIVWADVDPLTGLIEPLSVRDALEELRERHGIAPKAVMAVDWGGHLCDYSGLRNVVGTVPIIQDAAHSFGARRDGEPFLATVQQGDLTCFSFQAIKTLTTGDGGALVCRDEAETERARLLRWYGLDRRSSSDFRCSQLIEEVGWKYHMNDIAAAIGLANLPHVDRLLDWQRTNAEFYHDALSGLRGVLTPLHGTPDSAWWLYTLLVSDRDSFIDHLGSEGVAASPVHARNDVHPGFRAAVLSGMEDRPLPGVDFFAKHEVAIPAGWWLDEADRERVVRATRGWSERYGRDLVPPERKIVF